MAKRGRADAARQWKPWPASFDQQTVSENITQQVFDRVGPNEREPSAAAVSSAVWPYVEAYEAEWNRRDAAHEGGGDAVSAKLAKLSRARVV